MNKLTKNSTIYTPRPISEFIFNLLAKQFPPDSLIFDPCSGKNSLLNPWKTAGYQTWGNDYDPTLLKSQIPNSDLDFLTSEKHLWTSYFNSKQPALILCNPPFNGMKPQLAPEMWLDKIFELFSKNIPLVFFAPLRLRLCSSLKNKRYQKWVNGHYPPICSIISLPTKNTFPSIDFFCEILVFNIPDLESHYFFNLKETKDE